MNFLLLLVLLSAVLCSHPPFSYDALIQEYTESRNDTEADQVLDKIAQKSMLEMFFYSDGGGSRFEGIVKSMSRATLIPKKEIHILLFEKYCSLYKEMCVAELVKGATGEVTKQDRIGLFGGILSIVLELDILKRKNIQYLIPDHFIMAVLNTIKVLKRDENFLVPGIYGFAEFCSSDNALELLCSIIDDEVERQQIPFSAFVSWIRMPENSSAFDNFVLQAYKKSKSGKSALYPAVEIAKTIVNGPFSEKSTNILLLLLNTNVLAYLSDSPIQCQLLSHRLGRLGKYSQFLTVFNKVTNSNEPRFESLAFSIADNHENYEIVTKIMTTDILCFEEVEDALDHLNYIELNGFLINEYFDKIFPLAQPYIDGLFEMFERFYESLNDGSDRLLKMTQIEIVLVILVNLPKRVPMKLVKRSFEPLLNYFLDPDVDNGTMQLSLARLKPLLCSQFAQVSLEIFMKFERVVNKFGYDFDSVFINAAIEFILASLFDAESDIERFKIVHEYCILNRTDIGNLAELLLINVVPIFDPVYTRELVEYCDEHKLISKSMLNLVLKYIKTSEK